MNLSNNSNKDKDKKKSLRYGLLNESDKRILNKLNKNNFLSIRGSSPSNRLYSR